MKKTIFVSIILLLASGIFAVAYTREKSIGKKQRLPPQFNNKNMQKFSFFENKTNPEFSFSYPLFDNWETDFGKTANGEMWVRYIPDRTIGINFEMPPGLYFRFLKSAPDKSLWQKAATNSKGVKFADAGNENGTAGFRSIFLIKNKFLEITDPRGAKHKNFDGDLVWKTAVDSLEIK